MSALPTWAWAPCTPDRYPTLSAAVFVQQREFLELALDAYKDARRAMEPPKGETWIDADGGVVWSDAHGFYDELLQHLAARLVRRATLTGHAGPQFDDLDAIAFLDGAAPGAGRSPADKGHGCPALDSGAGSAAVALATATGHRTHYPSASPSPAEPAFTSRQTEAFAEGAS